MVTDTRAQARSDGGRSDRHAGRAPLISVRSIEEKLRERVAELAQLLLPNGRRDGQYWCVGDLSGAPGQSLKIKLVGANRGLWCDYVDPAAIGGDMLTLVAQAHFAGNIVDAIKWAKSWLGLDTMAPDRLATFAADTATTTAMAAKRQADEEAETAAKQQGARALWHHDLARPIAGTPAAAYLAGRGIDVDRLGKWPGSLKFHPEVWNREAGCKIPAMLAMMVTPHGRHVATHRIYLHRDDQERWVKIDSPNAKMMLGSSGGAFVPLRKGASGKSMRSPLPGEPVVMCEGIEDGLTLAMAQPAARIVAAYSLANMGAIVFPSEIGALVMACDRDTKAKAIEALERAIAKQQSRGMTVRLAMPPVGIKDFNDWLRGGGGGASANASASASANANGEAA